ncbi:acyltransferase GLAUCE [Amaranthus tricolor]|uniref:acyltransferase GLAUCE n=1 Tax=Amaranthus tricolor TaxID=29722 RepID=UPI0025901CCE|nr:acyltransferase GLAUCE [Amaranthus tricolor]
MGTLYQVPPPLLQDLKVTIQDSSLIFSPKESEEKTMFLSNIDQVLNFDVQTLHFFNPNPNFPPKIAFEKVKIALQNLCVSYHFLFGRIKLNSKNGRFEINCNNAGIGFVVASSEHRMDELGDLVYPNPSFEQLVTKKMDDTLEVNGHPLCIVQMTAFKCGGFAMGFLTNHAIFDGCSFKYFLQNLAALAWDKPLQIVPCNERTLLMARDPPRVTFPHPELLKLKIPIGQEGESEQNCNVFDAIPHELDFKIFGLSGKEISNLKEKAKMGPTNGKGKVTGFNVVSALVWRCKALSFEEEVTNLTERSSTMLFAVDIRSKLNPPLPPSFTGNAILTAYATTNCKKLEEAPLSELVDLVTEGSTRMNDEYARSAIDWGELYKGFPHGEFLMSSWWRLGFDQAEYPWGKPKYCCPLVHHRKDIILLFPDIDKSNDGVNILVALPHKEMAKFQGLFNKFLYSSL